MEAQQGGQGVGILGGQQVSAMAGVTSYGDLQAGTRMHVDSE